MPRICTTATVLSELGPIRIMTTHLEFYSKAQRMAQAKALVDIHRQACGHVVNPPLDDETGSPFQNKTHTTQAILCGDFNAEPDSDEIRFLASLTMLDGRTTFYQDAWRVAGDGPGLTQDWRTNRIASSLNVHRKRIDYVFVVDPFLRKGSAGRVLSATVAFDTSLTGPLASDHAGLVVDIVWPSRPPVVSDLAH